MDGRSDKERKAPTLVVVQPQGLPQHLLLQDAVLLEQVLDHLGLVATDLAGEGKEQDPERMSGPL